MNPDETTKKEVDQFILDEIDSVPHLEALLLLWNTRPKQWSLEEMSKSLYVSPETTQTILHDLERQSLVTSSENGFCYPAGLIGFLIKPGSIIQMKNKRPRRKPRHISGKSPFGLTKSL
jgi:hypothetical protein